MDPEHVACETPFATNMFSLGGLLSSCAHYLLSERTLCRCEELLWQYTFIFPPTHYRLDRDYQSAIGVWPYHTCSFVGSICVHCRIEEDRIEEEEKEEKEEEEENIVHATVAKNL